MKLVGTVEGENIDVKRFYLPGISIKGVCPKCQAPWEHSFGENYLSYPTVGAVMRVGGYCQECDHEWSMGVVLSMSLSLVGETQK
jgi:hypothetical protein